MFNKENNHMNFPTPWMSKYDSRNKIWIVQDKERKVVTFVESSEEATIICNSRNEYEFRMNEIKNKLNDISS